MSNPGSQFKRYLIEVSLEHFDIVRREGFWPDKVRVRNFKGNGKLWKDTEVVQEESDEISEHTTTNEDNEETED